MTDMTKQEISEILMAMEELADLGEFIIEDEKVGFDQRHNYKLFKKDYFTVTHNHWERHRKEVQKCHPPKSTSSP